MLNYTLLYNYLCNYITIRLASNSEYLRDSQENNPRHHEGPDLVLLNRPYVKKSQIDGIAILDFRLIT